MTQPLVSVVMPVFNGAALIGDTLESIFAQTYPNIEILTIDDGSTDNSAEVIGQYGDKIRYIKQDNAGPAAARNNGIKQAKGEYIAFLDADDIWFPQKVEQQIALMQEKSISISHTGNVDFNEHKTWDCKPKIYAPVIDRKTAFEQLFFANFIVTSTVIVTKLAIVSAGLFDENRKLFAVEDYDLWLRVVSQHDIGFLTQPLIKYRVHAEGISRNIDRSYINERNVLDKWYNNPPVCMTKLNYSKNKRYEKLMLDWGDDFLWIGETSRAKQIYRESLSKYGFSMTVLMRFLKAQIKSVIK
jgi:glycosyltransferase involved in cell wall biosynthesis